MHGVGDKTIADIKRAYSSEDGLINALIVDKVSLRDDIVRKLRKFYGIE